VSTTLAAPTLDREAATDQAVKRLIRVMATGYMPQPIGFASSATGVEVHVQQVEHLTNWQLHCDARFIPLASSTQHDSCGRVVERTEFTIQWLGIEFTFAYMETVRCPHCGSER